MARRHFCTVLQVKPYSGYYRSCLICKRKLRVAERNSTTEEGNRYQCRSCHIDCGNEDLELCYCLILTVTDHPSGSMVVSLFGRSLEKIFGLPATQMQKYLNGLEDGWVSRHAKVIKALEMLLVGTCVELTFGMSHSRQCAEVGQKREMNQYVATGVRLLGTNRNQTVLSILSNQVMPPQKPAAGQFCRDPVSMTQQNSADPNYSSFLYDIDSQITNTFDQKNVPDLLRLESFVLESQSGRECASDVSHMLCSVDDKKDDDVQKSEEIVCVLESEWLSTQTTQQQKQELDTDLVLSEEVVSELQESFDHSRDSSPPLTGRSMSLSSVTSAMVTPLSYLTGHHRLTLSSSRLPTSGGCCGTPELFSSYKKLTPQERAGELVPSLSFTPELFGPTPLVCCRHGYPTTSSSCSTPLSLSGKTITLQAGLVDDGTITATHGDSESSQELLFYSRTCSGQEHPNFCTPKSQHKRSFAFECTISSPDLFS